MNICVIGAGYVGLVTGACLAYLENQVICVDSDQEKIAQLKRGSMPFYEPGLKSIINICVDAGRLRFTVDLAEAVRESTVSFIAVGTPPLSNGAPDISSICKVAREIGAAIGGGGLHVVVNKSTVPVGCTRLIGRLVTEAAQARLEYNAAVARGGSAAIEQYSIAPEVVVISNPEFLREGSAIYDMLYPDRIVIGSDSNRGLEIIQQIYAPIINRILAPPDFIETNGETASPVPLMITDPVSAEMIKYSANAFLATKISFANEIANICERVGADVVQVMQGIGLDKRIGKEFLRSGVGWGGSCFGKDLAALKVLAEQNDYHPLLLQATQQINLNQRLIVVEKLEAELGDLEGRTVALLGLSFKPDTDDVRDAPSAAVARELLSRGALVKAFDPVASANFRSSYRDLNIAYTGSAEAAAEAADAVVIVTDWPQFKALNLRALANKMRGSILLDGRNMLNPSEAIRAGLRYIGIGR